ncbi:hypothetical protein [Methylobacterium sp. J-092]|nr:hypothetical protein [Methylobacterium sp. J-092]
MHLAGIDGGLDQEFLRLGEGRAQFRVLGCERHDQSRRLVARLLAI